MNCISCLSKEVIKNGKSRKGAQSFRCKSCNRQFQENYINRSWLISDKRIIKYVKEGVSIRSISRLLEISPTTLITRIKNISKRLERPFPIIYGKEYEIDEMKTYIGKKKREIWITYALRREDRNVIDFTVGSRSKRTMRKVTETIVLSQPLKVFTDKYISYFQLIPNDIHVVRPRCTNRIERKNLTLRTHLKRLNRKTLCFSKSLIMLIACLKIYFWA